MQAGPASWARSPAVCDRAPGLEGPGRWFNVMLLPFEIINNFLMW